MRAEVGAHPGDILRRVGGVKADQEFFFRETVDDQVVDAAAVRLAHYRVAGHADLDRRHLVGHDAVEELRGVAAADAGFAHVGDIEEPGRLTDRHVFFDDARVLYRHLPAGEGDDTSTEFDVEREERRAGERFRHRHVKVPARAFLPTKKPGFAAGLFEEG